MRDMGMMIRVLAGPDAGRTLTFAGEGPIVLGRSGDPDEALQFLTDATVSRQHLELRVVGEDIAVRSLKPGRPFTVQGVPQESGQWSAPFHVTFGRTEAELSIAEIAPRSAEDMPVRRLATYALGDELGRGTFGCVLEARDLETGETVAIKRFRADSALLIQQEEHTPGTAEKAVQYFQREMALAVRLQHPHIVGYRAIGREAADLFIVMERIDGGTGEEEVQIGGPFDAETLATTARHLLDALRFAHDLGIVHRDIKPSNVMLDRSTADLRVLLLDFGLARDLEATQQRITRTGENRGAIGFMSPEALRDAKRAGPASDLFSLAATLFFLATGELWFDGDVRDFVPAVLSGQHRDLGALRPDLPAPFVATIHEALAVEPAGRPADADAMAAALFAPPSIPDMEVDV